MKKVLVNGKLVTLTSSLLVMGGLQAATLSFTDTDYNSVNLTEAGSVVETNDGLVSGNRETVFTVTGLDLNEDSINDTFSFTLVADGSAAIGVNASGYGVNGGGSNGLDTGETITFSVTGFNFTSGNVLTDAPAITFNGFTNSDTAFLGAGESALFGAVNVLGAEPSPSIPLLNLESFTVAPGAASTLRVADLDFSFDFSTVGAVPEPSSAALIGLGGITLILRRRR